MSRFSPILSRISTLVILIASMLATGPAYAVDKDGRFVLVIDPGHGGKDPGAVNGKNQEKTINLNVALKMGKLIEENCKDVKVIYTRKTDVFVELYKRADIANKANADMFISVHTNSAKNKSANGAETYLLGVEENRTSANLNVALEENKAILLENDYETHYEGYDPNSPESMIIFEFMQNEFQKESLKMATFNQNQMVKSAKRPDRGVHQAGYLVLWKSAMPSILIELGFISNDAECRYLVSQKGVDEMSQSLYKAFKEYLDYHNKQKEKAYVNKRSEGKQRDGREVQARRHDIGVLVQGQAERKRHGRGIATSPRQPPILFPDGLPGRQAILLRLLHRPNLGVHQLDAHREDCAIGRRPNLRQVQGSGQ